MLLFVLFRARVPDCGGMRNPLYDRAVYHPLEKTLFLRRRKFELTAKLPPQKCASLAWKVSHLELSI